MPKRTPRRRDANEFIGASDATLRKRIANMIAGWKPTSPVAEDTTFKALKAHVAELERRRDLHSPLVK